ncbi:hypothetical protein DCC24_01245 [Auritidibacter sp. NML100628]|nr:hypothetical protein DCC24_01245 [Auritidibacter sp. NML100628]
MLSILASLRRSRVTKPLGLFSLSSDPHGTVEIMLSGLTLLASSTPESAEPSPSTSDGFAEVEDALPQNVQDSASSNVESLGPVLGVVLNLAVGALVGLVVAGIIVVVTSMAFRRRKTFHAQLRRLYTPMVLALVFLGARIALGLSGRDLAWYSGLAFILLVCVVASFAWLGLRVVSFIESRIADKYHVAGTGSLRERRIQTQMQLIRRIVVAVIVVIAVSAILLAIPQVRALGAGLLASAGLISVVAGLAVQSTLTNVFAGIQLAFTDAIRVGDVVAMDDYEGTVEDITLSYVVLKIWDGRRILFPSSHFTTTPYENFTRVGTALSGVVEFDVDWQVPMDNLRERLRALLASTDLWDGRDASMQVTDAASGMLHIRAVVSARNYGELWDLRCLVREDLATFIRTEHPEVIYRMRIMEPSGPLNQTESSFHVAPGENDRADSSQTKSNTESETTQQATQDQHQQQPRWENWYDTNEPPAVISQLPVIRPGESLDEAVRGADQSAQSASSGTSKPQNSDSDDAESTPETQDSGSVPLTRSSDASSVFTSSIAGLERGRDMAGPGEDAYAERARRTAESTGAIPEIDPNTGEPVDIDNLTTEELEELKQYQARKRAEEAEESDGGADDGSQS